MKKGILGAIIIFFIITIAVAVISYVIGTILSRQGIAKRALFEASLISESDKVETYVRSYQKATELSLIQSIYDTGVGTVILESDFNSIYSEKYNMPYWQVYDNKYVPTNEKIANSTASVSAAYMTKYLEKYKEFSLNNFPMILPDTVKTRPSSINDDVISLQAEKLIFHRDTKISDQKIVIDRNFVPYAEVKIKFGKMLNISRNLTEKNELNTCIIGAANKDAAQTCLNNTAKRYEKNDISVKLTLMDFNNRNGLQDGIVNVSIYQNTTNYTIYVYPDDLVKIKMLGVFFLAKVGNLIEYDPDQVAVKYLSNFRNCGPVGIISKTDKDECPYLQGATVISGGCEDTDRGIKPGTAGITKNTTNSYADRCVDDMTLTENYCLAPPGARIASTNFKCDDYCKQSPDFGPEWFGVCKVDAVGGYCLCYRCLLKSANITSECSGGYSPYCEQNEKIKVDVSYEGNNCPNPAYIQINASDLASTCSIRDQDRSKCPVGIYDMTGINMICSGSPCSGEWVIHPIL